MFDYSNGELATIDSNLEPKLAWAKERSTEAQQLALDATRILSCTEGRLDQYLNKGFFKRCWYGLTGKTGELHRANDRDLIEMQKVAWRYLTLLQERDLMLAHSIITVRNNLLTLAVAEAETRREIERMANRVYERFVQLEERMSNVEVATGIHGWLLTLEMRDYQDRYNPRFRLLAVVRDFFQLKGSDWNIQELFYLQKGVKEVGLPHRESVSLSQFLDELVDEIEEAAFEEYTKLVLLPVNGSFVPGSFVVENIAAPSYVSLFELVNKYSHSAETIDTLADQLSMERKDAIKTVMKSSVQKQGIDLERQVLLRDLAVELLHCMQLARELYRLSSSAAPASTGNGDVAFSREQAASPDATDLLTKAENGDVQAQFLLGRQCGEADHWDEAKEWWAKAAAQGHLDAQESLADVNLRELEYPSTNDDVEYPASLFRAAAQAGRPAAQAALGFCYEHGVGVEPDSDAAAEWLTLSARQGYAPAAAALALHFRYSDDRVAFRWARQSAEHGFWRGQRILAEMHNETEGKYSDKKQAARLYRQAADQGDAESCYQFGCLCANDDTDFGEAMSWFKRAADMKHPVAMYDLGVFHRDGVGGAPADRWKACELIDKSAQLGYPLARVDVAVRKLLSQDYDSAEKLALACLQECQGNDEEWWREFITEELVEAFGENVEDSRIHTFLSLPAEKYAKAQSTFLQFLTEAEIPHVFYDDTFWEGGAKGIALSGMRVFWSEGDNLRAQPFSYGGFGSARYSNQNIIANDYTLSVTYMDEDNGKALALLLRLLHRMATASIGETAAPFDKPRTGASEALREQPIGGSDGRRQRCSRCGAELALGKSTCWHCDKSSTMTSSNGRLKCPKCGAELALGKLQCWSCRTKVM